MNTICENRCCGGMSCDNAKTYYCPDCQCDRNTTEERKCVHCGNNELMDEYVDAKEPIEMNDETSGNNESCCYGECLERVGCERCIMNNLECELSDTLMKLYEQKPERYLYVDGLPYPFVHGAKILGYSENQMYGYKMKHPDDYTMEILEFTGVEGAVKESVSMKFNLNGDWVWRLDEMFGLEVVDEARQNTCISKISAICYAMRALSTCLENANKS